MNKKTARTVFLLSFMLFIANLAVAFAIGESIGMSYQPAAEKNTLTLVATAGGTTDPPPGTHKYELGEVVVITAIPSSGHVFTEWATETGVTYSENPLTVTIESGSLVYIAVFDTETPPVTNILRNPGVEDDADGNDEPDYWEDGQRYSDTGDNIFWCPGDQHTGSYCIDLYITKDSNMGAYTATLWRQAFDLDSPSVGSGYALFERGKTYKYRFWGRTDSVEIRFVLLCWDASGNSIGGVAVGVNSPSWTQSAWQQYTIPQEAKTVKIGPVLMQKYIDADVAEGATVWGRGDDFEVQLVTDGGTPLTVVDIPIGESWLWISPVWFVFLGASLIVYVRWGRKRD